MGTLRALRSSSAKLSLFLLSAIFSEGRADVVRNIPDLVEVNLQRIKTLNSSLDDYLQAEGDGRGDYSDQRVIRDYYKGIQENYIQNSLIAQKKAIEGASAVLMQSLNVSLVVNPKPKETAGWFNKFQGCLDKVKEDAQGNSRSIGRELDNVILDLQYSRTADFSTNKVKESLDYFESELASKSDRCCNDLESTQLASVENFCTELKQKVKKNAEDFLMAQIPASPRVPDPLANDPKMTPVELSAILKKGVWRKDLNEARNDGDNAATLEESIFQNIDDACNMAHEEKKKKKKGTFGTAGQQLAKALKCQVIPAIATYAWDTEWQKVTLGLSASQIEGDGWDVNCTPAEIALWDQMRPTDPNIIAQQWGIPQMADPPYIQSLRNLPPVNTPFPIMQMPGGGGLMTPFGTLNAQTVMMANQSGGSGVVATTNRVAASRSGGARSLAQASNMTLGTRKLASNISQGKNSMQAANILRSGAQKTRSLASTMSSNNKKLGSAKSRSLMAQSAGTARNLSRSLTGAKASRSTSQSILNSLNGRGQGPNTPTMDDAKQQNEAERRRIEKLIQAYTDNIELAKKKSVEVAKKIQTLILERDAAVSDIMGDIINKPPKTQAKKVQNLRMELLAKDKELGALKAEYDVYNNSVADQASLIQNLLVFGNKAANFPGWGGANSPNKLPGGFPSATGGGRGSTSWLAPWEKIWLPASAWAAPSKETAFGTEREWATAWDKFKKDVAKYVDLRLSQEKDLSTQALAAFRARQKSITETTATDSDSETMVIMESYMSAIDEETSDLLEANTSGKVPLEKGVAESLRRAQDEARGAREVLQAISLQYKDSYPLTYEDNPEVWWGMVPELLIY